MVAQQLPVVGAEEQQAVLQKAPFLQRLEHLAQLLVDRGDLGVVVPPHAGDLLFAGRAHVDRRFVFGPGMHLLVAPVLWRFLLQLPFSHNSGRYLHAIVQFQMPWQWIPGLVRSGKTDLQK